MVVKKSEYQKQFKACKIKKNQAAYLENLKLRHQRRDREFLHTPFCWEELNEEDEKVSSDCCEEGQPEPLKTKTKKEPETEYQSLAEILLDAREKAEAVRKQKHVDGLVRSNENTQKKQGSYSEAPTKDSAEEKKVTGEANSLSQNVEKKQLPNKSDSLSDFLDEENRILNKKLGLTYAIAPDRDNRIVDEDADGDIKAAGKLLNKDSKPSAVNRRTKTYRKKRSKEIEELDKKKPFLQASRSSVRVHSAASSGKPCHISQPAEHQSTETLVSPPPHVPRVRRPDRQVPIPRAKSISVSPEPPMKERLPFISYGIGDKEDNLATHRTHNVRSSVDVYPLALRAKTRHEEEHRRQKEKIHRAHSAEALIDKLSAPLAQDRNDWESEYHKQFHGYEPKDYERAISSHAVIPRSSTVRAVHRGGCLLVHVD